MKTYPECPKCGHSSAMHVKGVSPRYAGCMVMTKDGRRVPTCPCRYPPDALERLGRAVAS